MTTPEIERRTINPAAVLCVVLLILCLVLGFGCFHFWNEAKTAQKNCDSLIQSGSLVIDKADELLEISGKEIEKQVERDGFRFYADAYKDQFDEFAADVWGKAVERVK